MRQDQDVSASADEAQQTDAGNDFQEGGATTPATGQSKGIQAALARMAELRAAGIKPVRLDPIEKARRTPTSLRLAITAMCFRCMGSGGDPNVRLAIRECTSGKTCPLYPVRPYQASDDEADGGES